MFQMKATAYQRRCLLPALWLVATLSALTVSASVCGSFTFLEGVSDFTVTAGENSVVRIRFSLDTTDCVNASRHSHTAFVTVSGPHVATRGDYCNLNLGNQTCRSLTPTTCRCVHGNGDDGGSGVAEFTKNVTISDNFGWRWRYAQGNLKTVIDFRITGPTKITPDKTTPPPSPLVPNITAARGSEESEGSGGVVTVSVVTVALAVVVPVLLVIVLIAFSALIVWLCRRLRRYKVARTYDSPDRLQVGVSLEFTELRSHGNSAGSNAVTPEDSPYDIAT